MGAGGGPAAPASVSLPSAVALPFVLSFRLSDLLFLLFGCCALLFTLRSSADYELALQWSRGDGGRAEGSDAAAPLLERHVRAALPLIADVDGDGRNGRSTHSASQPSPVSSL